MEGADVAYVDMLIDFRVSLAVAARSGAAPDELERQIDSMERLLGSWRLASCRTEPTGN